MIRITPLSLSNVEGPTRALFARIGVERGLNDALRLESTKAGEGL